MRKKNKTWNPHKTISRCVFVFNVGTFQTRREWQAIIKVLKKQYQEYFIWQGCHSQLKERWSFPDKQNLKEFITIKPVLQKILKGCL